MIKYGLISELDGKTLEKTIDLICHTVKENEYIYVTEIGVYGGDTALGMADYISQTGRDQYFTGIENNKDGETIRCFYDNLIIGNSNEVYNQLEDNSQHLIFVDGCHCFAHVVSDFFCYADKVKVGGYMAFHDTGHHIMPMKDFQHGDKSNPDAYISVNKALAKIGLTTTFKSESLGREGLEIFKWQLIFDEWDSNNEAGGICVFKKLY